MFYKTNKLTNMIKVATFIIMICISNVVLSILLITIIRTQSLSIYPSSGLRNLLLEEKKNVKPVMNVENQIKKRGNLRIDDIPIVYDNVVKRGNLRVNDTPNVYSSVAVKQGNLRGSDDEKKTNKLSYYNDKPFKKTYNLRRKLNVATSVNRTPTVIKYVSALNDNRLEQICYLIKNTSTNEKIKNCNLRKYIQHNEFIFKTLCNLKVVSTTTVDKDNNTQALPKLVEFPLILPNDWECGEIPWAIDVNSTTPNSVFPQINIDPNNLAELFM